MLPKTTINYRILLFFALIIIASLILSIDTKALTYSTLIQTPQEGYSSGIYKKINMGVPWEITSDGVGNFYFFSAHNNYNRQEGNQKIYKVDSSGNVLLEFGQYGSGSSEVYQVSGLAATSSNLFVADAGNDRMVKFDSNGNYITEWGSAGSGDGQFNSLGAIKLNNAGELYVIDYNNDRIQVFDQNGNFLEKFGVSGTGVGQFNQLREIAFDSNDNLYVFDYVSGGLIKKFDSNNNFITEFSVDGVRFFDIDSNDRLVVFKDNLNDPRTTTYDTSGNQISTRALPKGDLNLQNGQDLWIEKGDNNKQYIPNSSNSSIQIFNTSNTLIGYWSSMLTTPDAFETPGKPKITNGNLYIPDNDGKVKVYDLNGNYISQFNTVLGAEVIAVDQNNNLYVGNGNVSNRKHNSAGGFLFNFGTSGTGPGELRSSLALTYDTVNNYILVGDWINDKLVRYDSNGNYVFQSTLQNITALEYNDNGQLYYAQHPSSSGSSSGAYRVVGGGTFFGSIGNNDGQFQGIRDLAIDSSGNIYVADYLRDDVQIFDPAGNFVDKVTLSEITNGEFTDIAGVEVYNGKLYITEALTNRLTVIDLGFQIKNLESGLDAVEATSGNLVEDGESTGLYNSSANIRLKNTTNLPLADIQTDMTITRDWSNVSGGTDVGGKKAYVHNLVEAPGTDTSYSLYVPYSTGDTGVYVCPGASSLSETFVGCSGGYAAYESDPDVSIVNIDGTDYWRIDNLTGTGAVSISGSSLTVQPRIVLRDSDAVSVSSDVEVWYPTATDLTASSIIYINYEGGEFTGGANITTTDVTVTCDTDGADPLSGTTLTNATVINSDNGVLDIDLGADTCADWIVVDIHGDGGNSLTNPPSSGNYSWSVMADAGGDGVIEDVGATLAYVDNDNDVNITAVVPPVIDMELYQQNSDTELTDPNTCSLGVLSLNTVNTCVYDLGTGTNNNTGVSVYITSDGALDDGLGNDINATVGTVDAGSEEYGFYLSDLGGGEYTAAGSFGTAHQAVPTTATLLATTSDTGNGTTLGQSVQHLEITHAASMSTDTIVGNYDQVITYTAYTN